MYSPEEGHLEDNQNFYDILQNCLNKLNQNDDSV